MLTERTPEQIAALVPHTKKWTERVSRGHITDREVGSNGIRAVLRLAHDQATSPDVKKALAGDFAITWVRSPREAFALMNERGVTATGSHPGHLWGDWWAAVPAYYEEHCGIDVWGGAKEAAMGLLECGWWWFGDGWVIASDRYVRINRDEQGRLHSALDVAIGWSDGAGFYALRGIRIARDLGRSVLAASRARAIALGEPVPELHPETAAAIAQAEPLTPQHIADAPNMEVRRVLLDAYGVERYMTDIKAKLIDEDIDEIGQPRKLYHAKAPWLRDEGLAFVVVRDSSVRNGTRREYSLRVDPKCKTALEAVASSAGIPAHLYRLAEQA